MNNDVYLQNRIQIAFKHGLWPFINFMLTVKSAFLQG